jgi:hypothetical protein
VDAEIVNSSEPAGVDVHRTIDREVDLVMSAVNLVASGGAPSTMVVGLRLTDAVIEIVRPQAAARGVVLEPLWSADESTADVRVVRERADE